MSKALDAVIELLDLEQIELDIFRGRSPENERRQRVFGGQVAGQALVAAGRVPKAVKVLRARLASLPADGTADTDRGQLLTALASAFLLTEPDVGSDPARLGCTAVPNEDGDYVLNGVKLWATNGTLATLLVVLVVYLASIPLSVSSHRRLQQQRPLPTAATPVNDADAERF